MPKIYIIILNWNGYKDTSELLESLQRVKSVNINILIVDNDSAGDDVEKLEMNYHGLVRVLKCEENLGFAAGNNVGIKLALEAGADFILLLNNDTIVEPDFLDPLLEVFETYNNAGIVAPRINYFIYPNKIWTEGGKISRLRGSGFAYSDKFEDEEKKNIKVVEFVSGCCMLIKTELFEKIGFFDENFFLYVEDTDFCFRTQKAGYKIYVIQNSKIYHKVGKSTRKEFEQLPVYYTTRNRLYFTKKNFRSTYMITMLYLFLVMLIKSFWWALSGKLNYIQSVKLAFTDFLLDNMGKNNQDKFKIK